MRIIDAEALKQNDIAAYEVWHRRLVRCWEETNGGLSAKELDDVLRWHGILLDRFGINVVIPLSTNNEIRRGRWLLEIHDETKAVEFVLRFS